MQMELSDSDTGRMEADSLSGTHLFIEEGAHMSHFDHLVDRRTLLRRSAVGGLSFAALAAVGSSLRPAASVAQDVTCPPIASPVVEGTPEPMSGQKIGVSVAYLSVPFYANFKTGLEDGAKRFGFEYDLRDGGGGDLAVEVGNLQDFIAQDYDLILLTPSGEGIIPGIIEANNAGIPVIEVNNRAGFESADAEVVTYVGADDVEYGRQQARLLNQLFGDDPARIGYVQGITGTSPQINRAEGFNEVLAEFPQYEILATVTDDFDSAKALAVTQDLLTRFPKGELDVDCHAGTGGRRGLTVCASERPRGGPVHSGRLRRRCPPGYSRWHCGRHGQPGSVSASVRSHAHGVALSERHGRSDLQTVLPAVADHHDRERGVGPALLGLLVRSTRQAAGSTWLLLLPAARRMLPARYDAHRDEGLRPAMVHDLWHELLRSRRRPWDDGVSVVLTQNRLDPLPSSGVDQSAYLAAYGDKLAHYDDLAWVDALRSAGMQVHQTTATFFDPAALEIFPDARPIDALGEPDRGIDWYTGVCPTHEAYLAWKIDRIRAAVTAYRPEAIFLQFTRFPGFWENWTWNPDYEFTDTDRYCFCDRCRALFADATGFSLPAGSIPAQARAILSEAPDAWNAWRARRLHADIERIAQALAPLGAPSLTLNTLPFPRADFDGLDARRTIVAQDLTLLSGTIATFELMTYLQILNRPAAWIRDVVADARELAGPAAEIVTTLQVAPLYTDGIHAPRQRSDEVTASELLEAGHVALDAGVDGLVFYHWTDFLEDEAAGGQKRAVLRQLARSAV